LVALACGSGEDPYGGLSAPEALGVTALPQSLVLAEDASLPFALLAAATGETTDPVVFAVHTGTTSGTLTGTPPDLLYTPNPDFHGADSLEFEATLGDLESVATVAFEVLPANDDPVGEDDQGFTPEDVPFEGALPASDLESDPLTWSVVGPPAHGAVDLDPATGRFTWTPAGDWAGDDALVWSASDGERTTGLHVLSLTVVPVDDPPVAIAAAFAGTEDLPIEGVLTGFDADGDVLSFALVDAGPHGTGFVTPTDARFTWTPDPNFGGSDRLTFTVSDGRGTSAPATVDLTVAGVNDPPFAPDLALLGTEDQRMFLQIPASDPDGDPLTWTLLAPASHGNATVDAGGRLDYLPDRDFAGEDSFLAQVSDGAALTAVRVSFALSPTQDPPTANPGDLLVAVDQSVGGSFSGIDPDGDPLTFLVTTPPAHGVLLLLGDEGFVYSPDAGYVGADAFAFLASDGSANSAPAEIAVTVVGSAHGPTAADGAVTVVGDSEAVATLVGTDPVGDPLVFSLLSLPTDAVAWLEGDVLHLVPVEALGDAEVIQFEVRDPAGAFDRGDVVIQYDADGDGLANETEDLYDTDPVVYDTDGDGLSDGAEVAAGLDPLASDPDADGLSDGVEDALGTDPFDADSDGDGFDDGVEVGWGGNPLGSDPDTDGDGIADVVEAVLGTDPLAADTDGDGLSDGAEGVWGTDPLTDDTDGDTVPDGAEALLLYGDPLTDESGPCDGQWGTTLVGAAALPQGVVAADVDADGDLDVVSASLWDDTIAWYENLGVGGFARRVVTLTALGASDAYPGDLDGDGDLDIAATSGYDGTLAWYENLGGGAFGPAQVVSATLGDAESVRAADLDGDGDADLLCTEYDADRVVWFENLGAGFGAARVIGASSSGASMVRTADLDADADIDVVVTELLGDRVVWFENLGGGSFGVARPIASGLDGPLSVEVADLTGDGKPDVAAAFGLGDAVWWWPNLGGGAFGPGTLLAVLEYPTSVSAADLDLDGEADLLVGAYNSLEEMRWFPNRAGVFGPAQPIDGSVSILSVTTGDLDGDGDADVIAAEGNEILWYHNNPVPNPDQDGVSAAAEDCISHTDPSRDDTDGGGTSDLDEFYDLTDPLDASDDLPTVDRDGDGLSDTAERHLYHTDPLSPDSDGDGLSDGDEAGTGTDPLVADSDGDGSNDGSEDASGTNPFDTDTDDDGLWDGDEATAGTDPLSPDTDGDGLRDGDEATYGADPLSADPDTDGDGLLDPVETAIGTNPLLADTDGDALSDLAETATWGTDPVAGDTDGDGAPDGAEVLLLGTDPFEDDAAPCAVAWAATLIGTLDNPGSVQAADLDSDGDADVLATSVAESRVGWYENLGAGSFGAMRSLTQAASGAIEASAADLDGDGDLDVIAASYYDDTIAWYENLGAGVFGPERALGTTANGAVGVDTGDLDGDGDLDVLAVSVFDDTVAWYENVGGGVFGPEIFIDATADGASDVRASDLDADGDLDLVVACAEGDLVISYENVGGGAFGVRRIVASGLDGAASVFPADVDGDGAVDVLAASRYDDELTAVLQTSAGFAPVLVGTAQDYPAGLSAADLDADGDLDLIAVSYIDHEVGWYENLGGVFGPENIVSVAEYGAWSVAAADLDGDGAADIVATGSTGDDVTWYRNEARDGDADGLSDAAEQCITGTDSALDDTDGGGADDLDELVALTDPLDPTDDVPAPDTDGDGVSDWVEGVYRTDPFDPSDF
jgi:hypothetical protein